VRGKLIRAKLRLLVLSLVLMASIGLMRVVTAQDGFDRKFEEMGSSENNLPKTIPCDDLPKQNSLAKTNNSWPLEAMIGIGLPGC
jgi:hypothetical protein